MIGIPKQGVDFLSIRKWFYGHEVRYAVSLEKEVFHRCIIEQLERNLPQTSCAAVLQTRCPIHKL